MVWLHGGGFSTGSGSSPNNDRTGMAHTSDVVVVSINHRLNVPGPTYLGEAAEADFSLSGSVGILPMRALERSPPLTRRARRGWKSFRAGPSSREVGTAKMPRLPTHS
jgi:carboxylesterase type B